jgi:hypothetical protein
VGIFGPREGTNSKQHHTRLQGNWDLAPEPEALVGKMGPSEQFKEVSIPGIPDLEDEKRNTSFYDHVGESAGETSDEE